MQKASLALLLSIIIFFSFIATIRLERNDLWANIATSPLTAFSSGQIAYQNTIRESPALTNNSTTRLAVYNFIADNPGVQFRGICTGLSIAIGTAEFHLGVLKKAGLISFVRDGKYKRFFTSKKFSIKEMRLISLLRHETTKEIIKKIIAENAVSHGKLASHLSITSQGLTWQINRLREEGIVKEKNNGLRITYSLNETYFHVMPELICILEQ